ncbi:MAG: carboxypeptidase-like regulatory domain-containing protein [Candidatus Sulfotelmatobacter sp.]
MSQNCATPRLLTLAIVILWPAASLFGQQHRIEGLVVDDQDHPIAAVMVSAYRGSSTVDSVTTGPDGKYSLKYSNGPTITTIIYEGSDWNPASIAEVSGKRDHTINKVLRRVGSELSTGAALDTLTAYHAIYFVNGAAFNEPARNMLRSKYSSSLQALRIPEDSALKQTKDGVKTLYGVK